MKEIGGYFELELRKGNEYHEGAISLNTARNALEFILITKKYTKVYIPYYTCDVILEPFEKQKVVFEFYNINTDLEPLFDFSKIKENEGFLYTNYFGIKDNFITNLSKICKSLIIDNSQAFFSKPLINIPTFYSCRKFFGVPDGAYLYLNGVSYLNLPLDHSENRFIHLLNRIEHGAEVGYEDFKINDNNLRGQPILQMSKLTKVLLCNIDYEFVKKRRRANFFSIHNQLSKFNELIFKTDVESVPMVYPFMINQNDLKQKLIDNKIYVATYWSNVLEWCNIEDIEYKLTIGILPLPIDQRYGEKEMNRIIKILKSKII